MKFFVIVLFLISSFTISKITESSSISSNCRDFQTRFHDLDSLLKANSFNGIVLVTHRKKICLKRTLGFSDMDNKTKLKFNDQFVIGSISKQITAVLILREFETGNLKLTDTISTFLPNLQQSWAQRVTIHQLLTHTHGIIDLEQPQEFLEGTKFSYSQIGYHLLALVLESIHKRTFCEISTDFFKANGLKNTFHPGSKGIDRLVKSYEENESGNLELQLEPTKYPAAGGFISTASDLILWNRKLYAGQFVKKETLALMKTKYAIRKHPIFGEINYGYGLLFKEGEQNSEIGALGYAPGFASASFYYPPMEGQVIVLSNVARNLNNFKETFQIHTSIMNRMKQTTD